MQKELQVNGRKFKIRELLNSEAQSLPKYQDNDTSEVKEAKSKDSLKQETMLCASLTEEEYNTLSFKEYLTLRRAILELNTPETNFWVTS
jgi:hypothetical protein